MADSPRRLCERVLSATTAYDVLSVGGERLTSASPKPKVRRAYLKLAAATHPDKAEVAGANDAFQRVAWAYRSICDPESLSNKDGWQADDSYRHVKDYRGQWYQDATGRWYTDWDYQDENGRWLRRTAKEVEILQRVKQHGVQTLTTPEDLEVYQRVYRTSQTMAAAQRASRTAQPPDGKPSRTASAPRTPHAEDAPCDDDESNRPRRQSVHAGAPAATTAPVVFGPEPEHPTWEQIRQKAGASGKEAGPRPSLAGVKGYDHVCVPASRPSVPLPNPKASAVLERERARRRRDELEFKQAAAQKEEELSQLRRKVESLREVTGRRAAYADLRATARADAPPPDRPLESAPPQRLPTPTRRAPTAPSTRTPVPLSPAAILQTSREPPRPSLRPSLSPPFLYPGQPRASASPVVLLAGR